MRPGKKSNLLLGATRSKGKMYEYNIPQRYHIKLFNDPNRLFPLSIGALGDIAEAINDPDFKYEFDHDQIRGVLFSARFLDAILQSRLNAELDDYLKSLIAASYYLCSLPGSSLVYSSMLSFDFINYPIQSFLSCILKAKISKSDYEICKKNNGRIAETIYMFLAFLKSGKYRQEILEQVYGIREHAYKYSNPIDLLLIDVTCALIKLKLSNSVWTILPRASNIDVDKWANVFQKKEFIKELWPSQQLLAKAGVFAGKTATIQMPTSAGKTKSTEIILRSFFLKNDQQSAVLVAPFKALCHEINDSLQECFHGERVRVNEFTDVFQKDYVEQEDKGNQVIITTPEKLVYILRQDPGLAEGIGLLILDEGHQFDSGIRGVTYELLITSLKQMLSEGTQWVLISAVLSNANSIDSWLNGENGMVVSGDSLSPTQKTVGFVDWSTVLGQIKFVNELDIDKEDFFVPRVIESKLLKKRPREKKDRFFPEKADGATVALHLGLSVVRNGCTAIFCGQKTSVIKICNVLVDIHSREYEADYPVNYSDNNEINKVSGLYSLHFGESSSEVIASKIGVLTHHASLPQGLRLSVEFALREQHARFVICTSTLAQGVNLPIRYLIFTNIYQAGEKLSVRDFHNLAGRAGRAGVHTEGTLLFANPEVYEKRKTIEDGWRWELIKDILRPENSEPCSSSLLGVFSKIHNRSKRKSEKLELVEPTITYLKKMVQDSSYKNKIIKEIVTGLSKNGFDEEIVSWQFNYKEKIINSIEGYLLSNMSDGDEEFRKEFVKSLTEETLAFFLASEEQKVWLYELFDAIATSLVDKVPEPEKRMVYSRTLIGVNAIQEIDIWIENNLNTMFQIYDDIDGLLSLLWGLIFKYLPSESVIKKLNKEVAPLEIATLWINSESFVSILGSMNSLECKVKAKTQLRKPTIQHVVDICEKGIAFDGMLIMGAVIELIESREGMSDTLIPDQLKHLQKCLKYGLNTDEEIALYERGFADREVVKSLAKLFSEKGKKVSDTTLIELAGEIEDGLESFPSYFSYQFQIILDTIHDIK